MKFDLEESAGRTWLRLALFVLFLILSLWGVGNGVNELITKHPGYYVIKVDPDEDVPYFSNGITYTAWLEGSTKEIKDQINAFTTMYRQALLRSYQLLDTIHEYPGMVNFATLNTHQGEELSVSPDFFAILQDLKTKTCSEEGVNMFSGALLGEYDAILSLSDISGFEPIPGTESGQRIRQLALRSADLSNFNLELDPVHYTVCFTVSSEYSDWLSSIESDYPILTAGRLSDAYRMALIREALENSGCNSGFLVADSGLSISLSRHDAGQYVVYTESDGQITAGENLKGGANTAFSFRRSIPMTENEFMYHVEDGIRLHPSFRLADGTCPNVVVSCGAVNYSGDIVAAATDTLRLFQADTKETAMKMVSEMTDSVSVFYY